jgi:hypothetical protein
VVVFCCFLLFLTSFFLQTDHVPRWSVVSVGGDPRRGSFRHLLQDAVHNQSCTHEALHLQFSQVPEGSSLFHPEKPQVNEDKGNENKANENKLIDLFIMSMPQSGRPC